MRRSAVVPKTDAALAVYSTNFLACGSAAPEAFNLTAGQMAEYGLLHQAFIASFNACRAEGARCKALVAGKEQAKAPLLRLARSLYAYIQASAAVTNENKTLIGVKVRSHSTAAVPPPAQAPLVTVLSVIGHRVLCKLADATAPSVRRRPIDARGAMILIYAGENPPPASERGWTIHRQTGKTTFVVEFPSDVPPGMACWVLARWYNRRGQYSPASAPARTYLQAGPGRAAA